MDYKGGSSNKGTYQGLPDSGQDSYSTGEEPRVKRQVTG